MPRSQLSESHNWKSAVIRREIQIQRLRIAYQNVLLQSTERYLRARFRNRSTSTSTAVLPDNNEAPDSDSTTNNGDVGMDVSIEDSEISNSQSSSNYPATPPRTRQENDIIIDLSTPEDGATNSQGRIINQSAQNNRNRNASRVQRRLFSSAGGPTLRTISPERSILQCPVCMGSCVERRPTLTKCGHAFCRVCINRAVQVNRKCPICNTELTDSELFRMYI